jgi:DNA helicase-2/ATP-dependent DNA helicase PcrA
MATAEEILNGLNDDQKIAAKHYSGPCFILAGPGAGKTMLLVARAQYMIDVVHIDPHKLLLFTFTNKAAGEIKNRIITKIGADGEKITVGTYHSICSKLLRQYASYIGYSRQFTIFDTDDSSSLLKKLCKGITDKPNMVAEYISKQKSQMHSVSDAQQNA